MPQQINDSRKKGAWSMEEDKLLKFLVLEQKKVKSFESTTYGISRPYSFDWIKISQTLGNRSGKQCRERWVNHLDPEITKRDWTPTEDRKLLSLAESFSNCWAEISRRMIGRSQNQVKIRWNSLNGVTRKVAKRKREQKEDNRKEMTTSPVIAPLKIAKDDKQPLKLKRQNSIEFGIESCLQGMLYGGEEFINMTEEALEEQILHLLM